MSRLDFKGDLHVTPGGDTMVFMSDTVSTDTLSLVVQGLALPWGRTDRVHDNLVWAAEGGTLEVGWTFVAEDGVLYPDAWAFDTSTPYCWDGCDGITTVHRAGWCRVNQEHADLDCGCGEVWHDEPDYDEEPF